MTFSLFLQSLAFNLLTSAIPTGIFVFLGIRYGLNGQFKLPSAAQLATSSKNSND